MKSGLIKLKVRVSGLLFAAGCLAGLGFWDRQVSELEGDGPPSPDAVGI